MRSCRQNADAARIERIVRRGEVCGLSWRDIGLDGRTFHELRHSYLSTLAPKGAHPKIMQELAVHASSPITTEIYAHLQANEGGAFKKLFYLRQYKSVLTSLFPSSLAPS